MTRPFPAPLRGDAGGVGCRRGDRRRRGGRAQHSTKDEPLSLLTPSLSGRAELRLRTARRATATTAKAAGRWPTR